VPKLRRGEDSSPIRKGRGDFSHHPPPIPSSAIHLEFNLQVVFPPGKPKLDAFNPKTDFEPQITVTD